MTVSQLFKELEVKTDSPIEDAFSDFWLLFPRREGKKDAKKAWAQIPASMHVQILTAAMAWRQEWQRRGTESHHIPLPATWLRGERYEDELPATIRQVANASHVLATPPVTTKSEMPQHVRDMIAKLKGKA